MVMVHALMQRPLVPVLRAGVPIVTSLFTTLLIVVHGCVHLEGHGRMSPLRLPMLMHMLNALTEVHVTVLLAFAHVLMDLQALHAIGK